MNILSITKTENLSSSITLYHDERVRKWNAIDMKLFADNTCLKQMCLEI